MPKNRIVHVGLRAGLLGAGAVALWFLVVDAIMQRPFHTPIVLGRALLGAFGLSEVGGEATTVVIYTIWHLAAFVVAGLLLAWMLRVSEGEPSHLAGLFLIFVVFEALFFLYVFALTWGSTGTEISWYQVTAANVLAAIVMGWSLLRSHPRAVDQMNEALAGRT